MDPWHLVPIAKLAWALRLLQLGQVRRWPWLFGYLVGSAALGTLTAWTIDTYGWDSVASLWVLPAVRIAHYVTGICVAFEAFRNADIATFLARFPRACVGSPEWNTALVNAAYAGNRAGNYALVLFAALALLADGWGEFAPGTFWIRVEPLACFYVAGCCVVCWWGVRQGSQHG